MSRVVFMESNLEHRGRGPPGRRAGFRGKGRFANRPYFLGYIVRPDYLLVRRRVVNRLKGRLVGYEKALVRRREDYTVFRYNHTVAHQLAAFAQQVPYGPLLFKYRGENSLTLRL